MILDRLTLDGFRLHRRTDILLGPGLTAIVGANGAGKSTLLESVSFALFGEQRGTKETLRGDDGAPYRVRLGFRIGEAAYVVERRPDRAFLARVAEDGTETRLAEGLSDTTRASTRLLGLGYEQFRNSFLAEQKGLAFLRFRSSTARQEEVARMLGLDRLQRAERAAGEARRAAGVEARALEGTVGDEGAIRAAHREAEEAVKRARTEARIAKIEAKQASEKATQAEPAGRAAEAYLALVAKASAAEEAVRQARIASERSRDALSLAEQEAEEAEAVAEAANHHAELLAQRSVAEKVARDRDQADRLDPTRTARLPEAATAFQDAQTRWRESKDAALVELAAAREAERAARRALDESSAGDEGAPCPVCGRPLGAEAEVWRLELSERLRQTVARLRAAESQANLSEPSELGELKGKLMAAELRAGALGPTLAEVDAGIAEVAPAAARARSLAGAGRRLADARARAREAEVVDERAREAARATAEALRATGMTDEPEARRALAEAAAVRTAATAAEAALRTAEASLKSALTAEESAKARLQEARARRDAFRAARSEESLQGAVATEMRALRTALNGALRPDLEARAGELLERMTAGRYRRVRLSADFEPTVVDEETERAVLSGGEEDIVALALRLALAELVQDRQGQALTLLMLDEAFGTLDAERRQSLLDVLVGLRGRYEQVLVVTHIDDVAQVADGVLRVTRDATGAARVTRE